jgi:hypothetical protein
MKPLLPITLAAVDTGRTAPFTEWALEQCASRADFLDIIFLTDNPRRKWAREIPRLSGVEGYSNFIVRNLHSYIKTEQVLIIQWDGFVLNPEAWSDSWKVYDFMGAPKRGGMLNGGFSLRSKRLLEAAARFNSTENAHPEDAWFTYKHRPVFQSSMGMRFAEEPIARGFAHEARDWDRDEWRATSIPWDLEFGFHSWLTPLPERFERPMIFHHSGDAGDVIYSLPVVKALGGGVIFLSGDNRYAYPGNSRWGTQGAPRDWVDNIAPLLTAQGYVWGASYCKNLPSSVDVDLNAFRTFYANKTADRWDSLFNLHQRAFNVRWPEADPWLEIDNPSIIPNRPIIINRTPRFQNPAFPWSSLLRDHAGQIAFVGTLDEYSEFCKTFPEANPQSVMYVPTRNLLEVARLIAGAKVFVGNQSCPLAIAHGLGAKVVVECWLPNSNCEINRPHAIYCKGPQTHIPAHWLI